MVNYNNINTFPATFNVSDYNTPNVKSYSDDLSGGLKELLADYSSYITTAFIDVGSLFHSITSDPAKYGISEEYVDPPTACLVGVYSGEGVPRHLCNDPEKHLFFDSYHPVDRVHALIGDMFVSEIKKL